MPNNALTGLRNIKFLVPAPQRQMFRNNGQPANNRGILWQAAD